MMSKILVVAALTGFSGIAQAADVSCVAAKQAYTMNYLVTKTSGVDRLAAVRYEVDGQARTLSVNFGNDQTTRDAALAACNDAVIRSDICRDSKYVDAYTQGGEFDGLSRTMPVTVKGHVEVLVSNGVAARSEVECRAIEGLIAAKSVKKAEHQKRVAEWRAQNNAAHANGLISGNK